LADARLEHADDQISPTTRREPGPIELRERALHRSGKSYAFHGAYFGESASAENRTDRCFF